MSSYASYCQDQAADCARRARLASSLEIVAYCRRLEFRGLRLAEEARETGDALGHDSSLVATYPVEYGKRAGELIARGARSLHQSLTQRKKRKRGKPKPEQEVSVRYSARAQRPRLNARGSARRTVT
jgi:hypothetical protein